MKKGGSLSQKSIQRQPLPLLSYKAEIIWDPETTQEEFRIPEKKKLIQSAYSQKIIKHEEAIKPPFVNLDRDNFILDIVHRKQYFKTLKAEIDPMPQLNQVHSLQKVPVKKTRRHKTKFRIIKNTKNITALTEILVNHINDNKKYVNGEILKLPQYEKSAPFIPSTIEFANQLIEDKEILKNKYGLDERNLRKNNCILEQVFINRMENKLKKRSQTNKKKQDELKNLKQNQDQQNQAQNQEDAYLNNDDVFDPVIEKNKLMQRIPRKNHILYQQQQNPTESQE